jgi:hypothetical protein
MTADQVVADTKETEWNSYCETALNVAKERPIQDGKTEAAKRGLCAKAATIFWLMENIYMIEKEKEVENI